MGYRIYYVAARMAPEDLAERLGRQVETPARTGVPERGGWVAGGGPSGWSVLVDDEARDLDALRAIVRDASDGTTLYLCEVNETVMWASASGYSGGALAWSVSYAGEEGPRIEAFETEAAPDDFADLRNAAAGEQVGEDDVDDFFEVPLDLAARRIGGFRHDAVWESWTPGPEDDPEALPVVGLDRDYPVLHPLARLPRKGLLARLLGR